MITKNQVKKLVPPSLWGTLSYFYRVWLGSALWYFNPERQITAKRLQLYRNKHEGERCFIIGNGPSLKGMELSPLRNEYTFGLNRIYILFPEIGFKTTYLVSVNHLVLKQSGSDISSLNIPKFISARGKNDVEEDQNTIFIRNCPWGLKFSKDPPWCVSDGATVTYVAMQLAYFMGFSQVILIGVDHSFSTEGPPGKEVSLKGDDPNHFSGRYFGSGYRWELPDLEMSEMAYQLARKVYAEDGREIIDATVEGKLQVFPKVNYDVLF